MSREQAKIVILTGAGISAESGIRTFRDQDDAWAVTQFVERLRA